MSVPYPRSQTAPFPPEKKTPSGISFRFLSQDRAEGRKYSWGQSVCTFHRATCRTRPGRRLSYVEAMVETMGKPKPPLKTTTNPRLESMKFAGFPCFKQHLVISLIGVFKSPKIGIRHDSTQQHLGWNICIYIYVRFLLYKVTSAKKWEVCHQRITYSLDFTKLYITGYPLSL